MPNFVKSKLSKQEFFSLCEANLKSNLTKYIKVENERTVQLRNSFIIGPLELRLIQKEDRRRIHHCDVKS